MCHFLFSIVWWFTSLPAHLDLIMMNGLGFLSLKRLELEAQLKCKAKALYKGTAWRKTDRNIRGRGILEELLLGWWNGCCLYVLIIMIDWTEWLGSSWISYGNINILFPKYHHKYHWYIATPPIQIQLWPVPKQAFFNWSWKLLRHSTEVSF